VHGAYYLVMWALVRVLGTSELGARLPSALAVTAAAAGVAAIGRRLASEQAGLAAGLTFALLPVASRYGQEVRSYALVMALAVLASYLLVRAMAADSAGHRWWIGYAAALGILGWMNLMSLLIIPAHGLTLAARVLRLRAEGQARRLAYCWIASIAVAALAVSPLVFLAWPQRHGTSRFLAETTFGALGNVPGRLTGSWLVLAPVLALAVAAFKVTGVHSDLNWLCLPWLVLPPLFLLVAGVFTPLYDPRYILCCIPALGLLAGSGLDLLARRAGARFHGWSTLGPVPSAMLIGLVAIGALGIPAQLTYRAPAGHGDNIRLAAQIVAEHERPGDAVLYQPPWWRQIAAAYPFGFNRLLDVSLARTPDQAGNFTGTQLAVSQIPAKLAQAGRVWLVEFRAFRPDPALSGNWMTVRKWRAGTLLLVLYTRGRAASARPAS
jgi:mannosyltransferase